MASPNSPLPNPVQTKKPRLTEPELLDPMDPLAIYDAYSLALMHTEIQAAEVSDFSFIRWGGANEDKTRWFTASYARQIAKFAVMRLKAKAGKPDPAERRFFWRYVVRDMDMEVPLPEWDGEIIHNGGLTEQARAQAREKLKGRGRVIAFSEWAWKPKDWLERDEKFKQTLPEWNKAFNKELRWPDLAKAPETESGSPEARKLFMDLIEKLRKELVGGKEHYLLENLATKPSHFRLGAGASLVRVFLPQVDNEKAMCYLDASPQGYPVYLKCGFEELDHFEIDKTKYGGNGIHKHVGMMRAAKQDK